MVASSGGTSTVVPPTVYQATATGGPPATMTAKSALSFSLTLAILGADVWKAAGASRVRAAIYFDPVGAAPPMAAETPAAAVYLSSDVAVKGSTKLAVRFTAPTTKGAYVLRVRMLANDGSISDFLLRTPVRVN
jgi:hypothetical protein